MRHTRVPAAVLAAAILFGCGTASPPRAPGPSLDAIRAHLLALQSIADAAGGTRAVGTEGDRATSAYVRGELERAGLIVHTEEFDVAGFVDAGPDVLRIGEPQDRAFEAGLDFRVAIYSAAGDVERQLALVGQVGLTAPPGSFGCAPGDLAGFPRGAIAVETPGGCLVRERVLTAQDAGAAAVIFADPLATRGTVRRRTLIDPRAILVPVVFVTGAAGNALVAAAAQHATVHVETRVSSPRVTGRNVIAETATGDPGAVVMLGAHMDSSFDGPGIDDDGSGVAVLLELARRLAGERPARRVRFAFWDAEEVGLAGSSHYLAALDPAGRPAIREYLNVDMVGGPNGAVFTYADAGAPPGSAELATALAGALADRGLASEPMDLGGASDHAPFMAAGIPIGGVFTGAAEIKTPDEAARFGGTAGAPMDACYHLACDNLQNVDPRLLTGSAAALADVLERLAGGGPAAP